MEYTVKKLSSLVGISSRTLRYYDEIGILKPARVNSSGYRIYGQKEVDTLQQILFYRELGLKLDQIKNIITSPNFDEINALKEHHNNLLGKRKQLDVLIGNVEKSIAAKEGRIKMTDKEKFEGFKEKKIKENEKEYGKEVREKYGDDTVNKSNAKFRNMTQEQYEEMVKLTEQVNMALAQAFKSGDPASELAQEVAELHKKWLQYSWPKYSKEAHAGLAQMYVDDERFKAYYDKEQEGVAEFLRDAIFIYTGTKR